MDCWAHFEPLWSLEVYITWITCAIYIIPFIMLLLLYGRICMAVWRSMSHREPTIRHKSKYQRVAQDPSDLTSDGRSGSKRKCQVTTPRAHVRTMSKSKLKTVKLTLTVILCYLICWGPFFIAQMWAAWDEQAPFTGKWHLPYYIYFQNQPVP